MPNQMKPWFEVFPAGKSNTTRISIYDGIGSGNQTSNDFINALNSIKTKYVDVYINSDGGDIMQGFACYDAIKAHPSFVTTYVDTALSIASLLAIAGDKVVARKNSFIMVHDGYAMKTGGTSDKLRKEADLLDKFCDNMAAAYAEKTGKSAEEWRTAMKATTWYNAREAKSCGLVDEIEGMINEKDISSSVLHAVSIYENAPVELRKYAARLAESNEADQRKEKTMNKIMHKDGKWFMGDEEVDVADVVASVTPKTTTVEKPTEDMMKAVAQARDEGIAQGRKEESEYRAMFNSVVGAAKMTGNVAVEFEKNFYGRAESDLKFLASHAIGKRAQAVGEGAPGNGEGEQANAEEKADQDLVASATKRFAEEPDVRRMFGLSLQHVSTDEEYKSALGRYIARERQWANDNKKK